MLELVLVQLSSDGNVLKGISQTHQLKLKQDTYDRIRREGLLLRYPVKVLPGTDRIRFVVRDSPSGAMGSLTIPVSN